MSHSVQAPGPSPVTATDRARIALQGATLNFGDELTGLLGAVANVYGEGAERLARVGQPSVGTPSARPGDVYRDIRDVERAQVQQFREDRPGEAMALEMGGGLLSGGAAGAQFARSGVGGAMAAAPLPARATAAGALGAVAGGAAGAGEAPTMTDIPRAAAVPAAMGAVLGPAAEVGATVAGRLAHAASPQRGAERMVARAIDRSDLTPDEVAARVQAMGPGAMLADVSEPAAAALETVANQPGATRGAVGRQLAQRSRQQAGEVTEPFGPGRVIEMGRELAEERQARAGPLYLRAFEQGVENTDELAEILGQSDAVKRAWGKARRAGLDEATAAGEVLDPRMLGTASQPSLRGWQAITMQLNDMIASAQRGANPAPSAVSRLTRIRDRINAEIDRQNPAYAQARATWAGSKAFEDAMQEGRRFLTDSSSVTTDTIKNLSDVDRAAYRVGVAQAIQDRVERMGDLHDVTRLFRTAGMRAKLRALFPEPEQYADILNRVEAAAAKQRTMGQIMGNSATARRQQAAAEGGLLPSAVEAAADVATGAPVASVAGQGVRSMARRIPTSREATRDIAGRMLSEQSVPEINRMLQLLEAGGTPFQRNRLAIGAGIPLGVIGAPVAGALAPE